MVLLIFVRSMSTRLAETFPAATLDVDSENMQRIAMIVILESVLYKLKSPVANEICQITNQKCDNVHSDNR